MEWSDLLEKVYTLLTLYGLRVVSAIAIFRIGRWVAKGITRVIERLMLKRKVDETLVSFVSNIGRRQSASDHHGHFLKGRAGI